MLDQRLLRLGQALGIRRLARGDQAANGPQRRQFPLALLGRLTNQGGLGAQIVQLALAGTQGAFGVEVDVELLLEIDLLPHQHDEGGQPRLHRRIGGGIAIGTG